MRWGWNRILRVGKNACPILSHLWAKDHDILGRCRGPLVLSNAVIRLSVSCFVQKIIAIKSRSRRETQQIYKVFWPATFLEGWPRLFYGKLLARFTVHRFAKFGWVPLLISVCEAWQWHRMQNLRIVGKNSGPILSRLWTKVHGIKMTLETSCDVSKAFVRLCISCFVPKI